MTLNVNKPYSETGPVSVWTFQLGIGNLPALLGTFLRHGRFQLRYTAASNDGRILARILRATGILSAPAKPIQFSLHGLRVDDPESARLLVQGWLPNQFTELFMHVNDALLAKFKYPDSRIRRDRVLINLRKAAAQTTVDVLALLELAHYHHRIDENPYSRIVIITPHAVLAHLIPKEWVGKDVEFIAPWSQHYSLALRLGRSIVRVVGDSIRPKKPKMNLPSSIAASVTWGIDSSSRLNDLFWWRESKIPTERTILFFYRPDMPATASTVAEVQKLGIRCVVIDKNALGDSPQLLWRPTPGFVMAITRFWRTARVFIWGIFRGRSRRWIARQTMDMLHTSERMEDFLSDYNVRGLFHDQDGGLDYLSLACDATNAARIGCHWSYFPWPEAAVARLHQVYFTWGPYQAEMLKATGSRVDHVLWSGCTIQGAYPGSDSGVSNSPERLAVISRGASRVLTLFDTSLPCQIFYEFFLGKVIKDSRWGMLIKPKNSNPPWLRYDLPGLKALYEKAIDTGRVIPLNASVSPAQASAAADFSVAVDINSAAVCSSLAGHKSIHLDYVRVHTSPMADWATLYKSGPNQIVFDNPDELWDKLNHHYDNPSLETTLGVAEQKTLEHIDPFRDGRAGERMGQYLAWYLEALDDGLKRDSALTQADERYADKWGFSSVVNRFSDSSESPADYKEPKSLNSKI